MQARIVALAAATLFGMGSAGVGGEPPTTYAVGVAKVDITPSYPVRLSGFGFRRTESEGVTQRIWAKALAIDDGEPAVLLTIDICGISADHVRDLAARLHKKNKLKPERLAVTVTHTHTAPMVNGVLATLFGQPIPEKHQEHIDRYTTELLDNLEKVAVAALADRKPTRLSWGIGQVGFAANRRTKGGPVDHDLPVLAVRDTEGKLRALYASYACHCVTLTHNKIGGDWAGFAQQRIEDDHPGVVALISIGGGADSNPDPRGKGDDVGLATRQGSQIADEVKRVLSTPLRSITGKLDARVRRLNLPLAPLPDRAHWEQRAQKADAVGYHARVQLDRLDRGETLRGSIDYPVQTWAFGDSLAMVFLPGEVVVDYSLRLKKELDPLRLWVNGYSNDVPCYIPSERVLKEGGYEGGGAMTYYDLPGPLQSGLEQKIIDAVRESLAKRFASPFDGGRTGGSRPMSPPQSLAALRSKSEFVVDLIAAEPLVIDPVAIDWGPDGCLWVAEMCDYPMGTDGQFQPGGRVRILRDTDSDGHYDEATIFLDNIPFPTGVRVWRKGVLICAAPDILYAEDANGDGRADVVKKLFSGFGVHNYQARVNSLEYGLDGWVYGSCGLFGGKITSFAGGPAVDLGNRDFRLRPDTGELAPATGRTQQGRVRDDWGNWFGCENGVLCWHYPLADHYLRRNPHVAPPQSVVNISAGPGSPRLFPARPALQLFKHTGPPGHTTAACGVGIYRDDLLGREYTGNVFVCEAVNLVVHRQILEPKGATFAGGRAADEHEREFLASTDNWFRPVQVRTGPDGCLWVVDMYRYVIEHPQWIPLKDLFQLDLRAGSTMGRIYRVRPKDRLPRPTPRLDKLDSAGLVAALDSSNGWQRDLAGQMLIWNRDAEAARPLESLFQDSTRAEARLHALCVLDSLGELRPEILVKALADTHTGLRRHAVRLAEKRLGQSTIWGTALAGMIDDADPQVQLQVAYSLGEWQDARGGAALARLAQRPSADVFLVSAVLSSLHSANLGEFVSHVFARDGGPDETLAAQTISTVAGLRAKDALVHILNAITRSPTGRFAPWQYTALSRLFDCWGRGNRPELDDRLRDGIQKVLEAARATATDESSAEGLRVAAIALLGREMDRQAADALVLRPLMAPRNPPAVQQAALAALAQIPGDDGVFSLLAEWSSYTPVLKNQMLDLCMSRPGWQRHLLAGVDKQKIPAAHIDPARRQRLLSSKDQEVRRLAATVFGGAAGTDREKVLREHQNVLGLAGDRVRGKAVFAKSCASCHRLQNEGQALGPDLTGVAHKSPDYLLAEILDPSKNLDSRYIEYFAAAKSGQVFTGVLAAETATSITLRAAEGKEHVLLRRDVEELHSQGKSLMPDGLEKDLSHQDLADVIAYVTSGTQSDADAAALARQLLDGAQATEKRQAIIEGHPDLASDLLAALISDMRAGEEYQRIPWIWRVSIAAGRRNQADQVRRILDIALPQAGEPLRDWQAVVIGGGIINGISEKRSWPRDRVEKLFGDSQEMKERWEKMMPQAAAMADNEKTPAGTRYDALRIIALDDWERRGDQLRKYLAKGTNDELQMGAISGLSDMDARPVAPLLVGGLSHFSAGNRKLAVDALLRTEGRTSALLDALEQGQIGPAQLSDDQRKALKDHANESLRARAAKLLP
jgi:putative membrane-bound dehydrogenase-like protein